MSFRGRSQPARRRVVDSVWWDASSCERPEPEDHDSTERRLLHRACLRHNKRMCSASLSPREYHARRDAQRLAQREALRLARLDQTREAIGRLAPQYAGIQAVYLFGSIVKPGRHRQASDIDVAIDCTDIALESQFWRELEQVLRWNIDLRPYTPPLTQEIADYGELVYERESSDS